MSGRVGDVPFLFSLFVRGGRPRVRSVWMVLVVSAALAVASVLVPVDGESGRAFAEAGGVAKVDHQLQREDMVSAGVTARTAGERVEVTGARSEFSSTWVNPDGSVTVSDHAGQQRFRNGAGAWVDVDLTLAAGEDGTVAPTAHPLGLTLSGGGGKGSALVSVSAGTDVKGVERRISWGWAGVLPAPVLDGPTATYRDVAPGVNLRVVATRSGFEQFFDIASRAAVPAVAGLSWAMPVTATGGLSMRADADGGSSFLDPAGRVVSRIPAPQAWDANVDETRGGTAAVRPVKLNLSGQGAGKPVVTVVPDLAWLLDPARSYPVTVDPSYAAGSVNPSFDTFVQSGVTSDQSGGSELKVGTYDAGTTKARAFVTFPTSGVTGKLVRSASLSLQETWSYSCTAKPVDAWSVTADATTATKWTAQPGLVSKVGTATAAKGYSASCPAGRVGIPVTSLVQAWSGVTQVYGTPTGSAVLASGVTLSSGQSLASSNGKYYAYMQTDGNFVVYGPGGARWSTGTSSAGARVVMQSDGNLVVYSTGNVAVWNSGTAGKTGATLSMQTDGNLVIYQGATAVWNIGAAAAAPPGTIGVVAGSETDSAGWKRFASMETTDDPVLEYTYDRAPGVASGPKLTAGNSYSGSWYVPTTTPVVQVGVSDPDGNTVKASVEVWTNSGGSPGSKVSSCVSGLVASGATASCTVSPALSNNTAYLVRARTTDQLGLSSAWTGWKAIKVAASAPATPTISCPGYANGSWAATAPGSAVSCTVSFTSGSSPSQDGSVQVIVDGGTPVSGAVNASVGVSVPNTAGGHTVSARVTSVAGVAGSTAATTFGYGAPSMSAPAAGTTATGSVTVAASGPPPAAGGSVTATVQYRVSGDTAGAWTSDPDATSQPVTVASGKASLRKVVNVSGYATTVSPRLPVRLDLQVCFAYTAGGTTSTSCTWTTTTPALTRVPKAFGDGYPTAGAGPGQVALWTGEFETDVTDVDIPAYAGSLSLSRSHATFDGPDTLANWPTMPASGVLGPGWTLNLDGPDTGSAGLDVYDQSLVDASIALVDDDGTTLVFTTPTGAKRTGAALPTGAWPAADDDTRFASAALYVADTVTIDTDGTTQPGTDGLPDITLTEADGTRTTWAGKTAPTATTAAVFTPGLVQEAADAGTTTYTRDSAGRVTRILAPTGPGVTCTGTAPTGAGCRYLTLTYGSSGTATGKLVSVVAHLWNPGKSGGAGTDTATLTSYAYDASGRLASVTDPRTGLATGYTYDATTPRLASITPPGLATWRLAYGTGTLNGATTTRLSSVSRDPATGTGSPVRVASYVYGIDATQATTGLPDLRNATQDETSGGWNQASAPTQGFAVFAGDRPTSSTGDTPAAITTPADWQYASLQYTDADGVVVNTADYGAGAWQLSATDYDTTGNIVRTIDPTGFAAWQAATAAAPSPVSIDPYTTITAYNPDITTTAATTITYPDATTGTIPAGTFIVPAGMRATDEWGPARQVGDSSELVRPHTRVLYDEGAPTNGLDAFGLPYSLPTTSITGAVSAATYRTSADYTATQVQKADYNAHDGGTAAGDTSGWVWGTPTRVTTIKNPTPTGPGYGAGAGDEVRDTTLDSTGRTVETRQPSESGGTTSPTAGAGTWRTRFYTADASSPDAACRNTPEWNGLTCTTGPATLAGTQTLSRVTSYTMWLSPATTVETTATAGATRTTTIGYDTAGRPTTSQLTLAGITGSPAVPATTTTYSATTGLATQVTSTAGAVDTGYDGWGRATTYTPAGQTATTTTYDSLSRVLTVTDPKGSTTYGYGTDADGKVERRGMPTTILHSTAGSTVSFAGAYDAAGNLVTQTMPGGITQTTTYDSAGEPVGLTYTGPDDEQWLAWTQANDSDGRVVSDLTPDLSGTPGDGADGAGQYRHVYTYNGLGQLTRVVDTTLDPTNPATSLGCIRRDYTFTPNGARNGLTTTQTGAGTDCTSTGTTTSTRARTLDAADKITGASNTTGGGTVTGTYAYDALGRTTTLPAVDTITGSTNATISYRADDSVDTITSNGTTQTYTYDTMGRRLAATSTGAVAKTLTRGYADTSDNPAWTVESTAVTAGTRTDTTRYLSGLGGGLAATTDTITDPVTGTSTGSTLTLGNLHGDVVTTIAVPSTGDATGIDTWNTTDEYGNPLTPATGATPAGGATPAAYGWHGTEQRSADTPAGLTLMGARLFNSVAGSFTSTDPVYSGNDSTYQYPSDPINQRDLDGRGCGSTCRWAISTALSGLSGLISNLACKATGIGAIGCGALVGAIISTASVVIITKLSTGRWPTWKAIGAAALSGAIVGALGSQAAAQAFANVFTKAFGAIATGLRRLGFANAASLIATYTAGLGTIIVGQWKSRKKKR